MFLKMTKRKLKIYNILIILAFILIYELGYCNHTFTERIIQGEITTFYFSICRLVMYILTILATLLFNKKVNFENIEKSYQNKAKKIVLITYVAISLIILLGVVAKAILTEGTTMLLPQLAMLILALLGGLTSVIYASNDYKVNLISLILVGIVLSITCTSYNVLDEKKHFMEAYNISYGNLDFNNPVVDKQFMEELPRGTHYVIMAENFKIPYKYEEGQIPADDEIDSTPATYNPILYIPSAIGIFVGRILGGSVADVFICGKIMNLLTYMGLAMLVLEILPYKKNIAFAVIALPMFLCIAGTYSLDSLGTILITLFVAYCLKLYNEKENITFKQLMILTLIYCLTLTFKSMSYCAIGLLIFILPIKDIIKKYGKKIWLLILFAIVIMGMIMLVQPKITIDMGDPRGGDTGFRGQMANLIAHPTVIFKVAYNHVTQSLLNYNWWSSFQFSHFFSETSSWLFFIMLIYYIYIAIKDDSINFGKKEKIIFILTFLMIYAMTSAVLYLTFTPIGSTVLTGYAIRYVFPTVLLLLMIVSNKNMKNEGNKENNIIKLIFISNIILTISLVGAIFKW